MGEGGKGGEAMEGVCGKRGALQKCRARSTYYQVRVAHITKCELYILPRGVCHHGGLSDGMLPLV